MDGTRTKEDLALKSSDSSTSGGTLRSAYIWNALSIGAKQVVTFGISILLARILSISDFGLMTLVVAVTQLASSVQDLGIRNAVIYFKDNEREYTTYLLASMFIGTSLCCAMFFASSAIARVYANEVLAPLLEAASLIFLIGGARSLPHGILTKAMNFKVLAMIQAIAGVIAAATALSLALLGYGVWSLLANVLVDSLLECILVWVFARPRLELHLERLALSRIYSYGLPSVLSSLLWRMYDNSDFFIIGRTLGPGPLGSYNLAFRLATLVYEKIVPIVSGVSFPAFAAMEKDSSRVKEYWLNLNVSLSYINFPILVMLAVNAPDIIPIVYGEKWTSAVVPLQFLCVVGLLRTLTPIALNLSSGQGRVDIGVKYALLNVLLLPPGFYFGSVWFGILGVGVAWALLFPLTCVYLFGAVSKQIGISLTEVLWRERGPLMLSAGIGAAAFLARGGQQPGVLRVIASTSAGLLAAGICVACISNVRQEVLARVRAVLPENYRKRLVNRVLE